MRPPSSTAALSAATLFSRPTWSGTIISGKITVSRSATSGSSVMVMVRSSFVVGARFGIGSPNGSGLGGRCRGAGLGSPFRALGGGGCFAVEAFEDPRPAALLELEQDSDPREVDAEVLGQVADPHDPTDVVLRVEADVGRRSRRADQTLFLVDPQGSRMHADDARRHADHVDGSLRVSIWPAE